LSVGADDFYFFVVPRQFSQDIGEWPENQILIPDWTYFYCPGTTLARDNKKIKIVRTNRQSNFLASFLPIKFLPLLAPP